MLLNLTCIYAKRKILFIKTLFIGLAFELKEICNTYFKFSLIIISLFWGPTILTTPSSSLKIYLFGGAYFVKFSM